MDATREELVRLTNEWMEVIGDDHHKDRDCHFYIEQRFSYGKHPKWWASHYGYVISEYSISFETYQEALRCHIRVLTLEIDNAKARKKEANGN